MNEKQAIKIALRLVRKELDQETKLLDLPPKQRLERKSDILQRIDKLLITERILKILDIY